jgi:hypothetical protein
MYTWQAGARLLAVSQIGEEQLWSFAQSLILRYVLPAGASELAGPAKGRGCGR